MPVGIRQINSDTSLHLYDFSGYNVAETRNKGWLTTVCFGHRYWRHEWGTMITVYEGKYQRLRADCTIYTYLQVEINSGVYW